MTKKRNPNDATFRNVRAAKKRIKALEKRMAAAERWQKRMVKLVEDYFLKG